GEAGDRPVEVAVELLGGLLELLDGGGRLGRMARRQGHLDEVEEDRRGEGGGADGQHPVGRPRELLPGGVEVALGPGEEGGGVVGDVGGDVPGHVAVDPPGGGDVAAGLFDLTDLGGGQGGHEHRHAPAAAVHAGGGGEGFLG